MSRPIAKPMWMPTDSSAVLALLIPHSGSNVFAGLLRRKNLPPLGMGSNSLRKASTSRIASYSSEGFPSLASALGSWTSLNMSWRDKTLTRSTSREHVDSSSGHSFISTPVPWNLQELLRSRFFLRCSVRSHSVDELCSYDSPPQVEESIAQAPQMATPGSSDLREALTPDRSLQFIAESLGHRRYRHHQLLRAHDRSFWMVERDPLVRSTGTTAHAETPREKNFSSTHWVSKASPASLRTWQCRTRETFGVQPWASWTAGTV